MNEIKISRGQFPTLFGGIGFQNSEQMFYHITGKEHFNQIVAKCYREISPGFSRMFAGFADWSKEAMDEFCIYYEQMQKSTDTPIYFTPSAGRMHFSDEEIRDYCERVADNLAYLYFEKGVKHIRYYCFSNELSQVKHGVLINDLPLLKKYHELFYRAFQNRNLPVGLLATDATGYSTLHTIDWAIENMPRITEDFCWHVYEGYENDFDIYNKEYYEFFHKKCSELVKKCIACDGKRLILGEIGIQKLPLLKSNGMVVDINNYFLNERDNRYCALMLTEMAYAAMNAGVYIVNYWTYMDYPEPYSCAYSTTDGYPKKWGEIERFVSATSDYKYNQWGLLRWEENKTSVARPIYWALGLLAKFFKRNSRILDITTENPMLRACGVINRDGSVSVGIINRSENETEINLMTEIFKKPIRVYEYIADNIPFNEFSDLQNYSDILAKDGGKYVLKPSSITYFTTDYVEKNSTLFAKGVRRKGETLTWRTVKDKNHCYYRVYASKEKDFIPNQKNQIASTIANSLPITKKKQYYKVISVDNSGNGIMEVKR